MCAPLLDTRTSGFTLTPCLDSSFTAEVHDLRLRAWHPRAIQLRPRHPAQPADALPAGEAPDGAALRLHTINILVLRLHVIFS